MTLGEAQMVLNLPSDAGTDEIIDQYEEAVFEQASFFMRRTFIPKLAEARMKKLDNINAAGQVLGIEEGALPHFNHPGFEVSPDQGVEAILKAYNQAETQIKLGLANTSSAAFAKAVFGTWIQVFKTYANSFLEATNHLEPLDNVKLTDAPIFTEYQRATEIEKEKLVRQEFTRLSRLMSRD
jgi:hypothetical protein